MESVLVSKKYKYNIPKQVYNILYINKDNIKSFLFREENTNILLKYDDNKIPFEIIKLINAITDEISIYALLNLIIAQLYLYIIEVVPKYKNDIIVLLVQSLCNIYCSIENSRFKCIESLIYNKCSHGNKCARCIKNVKPSEFSTYDTRLQCTRPCITFCVTGRCIDDTNCIFSHVSPIFTKNGVIYDPPIENIYTPIISYGINAADPRYKTSLCNYYSDNNYCDKEDNCSFAHGESELRLNPLKYKNTMCHEFIGTGICSRGSNCLFSHKQNNTIATRKIIFNYKTELCKWYSKNNSCRFGENCLYIHT